MTRQGCCGVVLSFTPVPATAKQAAPRDGGAPAVARTGVMWKAAPWLDLDVGAEGRLNRVAPRSTVLAGATLRW